VSRYKLREVTFLYFFRNARQFAHTQQRFSISATKCGDCLAKCLQDETCKTCLEKLTELDTRDQAASYRTIVSYESEALKDFSFCVFQKHNVFQCQATIPTIPKVEPLSKWKGREMTEEIARSLLIGHLDDEKAPEVSIAIDTSDGSITQSILPDEMACLPFEGLHKAGHLLEGSMWSQRCIVSFQRNRLSVRAWALSSHTLLMLIHPVVTNSLHKIRQVIREFMVSVMVYCTLKILTHSLVSFRSFMKPPKVETCGMTRYFEYRPWMVEIFGAR
jgi:VDE lipocalin domain